MGRSNRTPPETVFRPHDYRDPGPGILITGRSPSMSTGWESSAALCSGTAATSRGASVLPDGECRRATRSSMRTWWSSPSTRSTSASSRVHARSSPRSACTRCWIGRGTSPSRDFQDEKMATLGKMSAGLAHELNNPASAASRSAKRLAEQNESRRRIRPDVAVRRATQRPSNLRRSMKRARSA